MLVLFKKLWQDTSIDSTNRQLFRNDRENYFAATTAKKSAPRSARHVVGTSGSSAVNTLAYDTIPYQAGTYRY